MAPDARNSSPHMPEPGIEAVRVEQFARTDARRAAARAAFVSRAQRLRGPGVDEALVVDTEGRTEKRADDVTAP